jgi:hypothetical protein
LSNVDRHSRFCAADGGGGAALLPYFWPQWQPSMLEQAGALIDHAPSLFSTSQGQFALRYFVQGDLGKMERLCLEQAALCTLKESREALLQVARDYRTAAEAQRRASIW